VLWSCCCCSNTTTAEFIAQFDRVVDTIQHRLEQPDIEACNVDISYASGVLSIRGELGTWVINQHNVTRQVWLSSPISGPSKYNWHRDKERERRATSSGDVEKGVWCSERDERQQLQRVLEKEFSQAFEIPVKFDDTF